MALRHPAGEYDRAKRIFKQLKAGVREFEELDLEEVGLLAVYYPHVLPCGECDRS